MRRSRTNSPVGGACPPCPPVGGGAGASKGSCNPGKLTRNPYLNFLRDFRQRNCGLSAVEVVRQGARAWNALSAEQRVPYVKQACSHPQRKTICPTPGSSGSGSGSRGGNGARSPHRGRSVRRSAASTASAAGGRMGRSASRGKGRKPSRARC